MGDVKEDIGVFEPQGIDCGRLVLSRRLAPTLSGSLKSSKKTKPCQRNNAIPPSGSTNGSGRWATRVNTPGEGCVRELMRLKQEVFMPLIHRPGEAQVDFGHALAKVSKVLKKVVFFVMALPLDAFFVMALSENVRRVTGGSCSGV